MTRQYIGARYVPIIDGEYNSEKVYEPLTVVTYNGSSYTSKKSVPAGTLPTNTEYWALTGNYNAQVEQYRQEVTAVSAEVTRLDTVVSRNITGRNFLFVGDSYATSNSEFTTKSWVDYTREALGLTAGTNAHKANQGGTGIAHVLNMSGVDVNTEYILTNATNWDSSIVKNNITDIVIAEGYNDGDKTYDEIVTAFNSMALAITANYPNVQRIYVAMIGRNYNNYETNAALAIVKKAYADASANHGYIFIENASKALCDNEYLHRVFPIVDVVGGEFHPNDRGSEIIAHYITEGIRGGSYSEYKGLLTANISAVGTGTLPTIYSVLDEDHFKCIITNFNMHIPTSVDYTVAGSWFKVADVTNVYFDNFNIPNRAVGSISCAVSSITANETFTVYTRVDVGFWNGGMYFRPYVEPHEGTTKVAFSSAGVEFAIPR